MPILDEAGVDLETLLIVSLLLVALLLLAWPAISRALARQKLLRLSPAEKISLALKGSRVDRAILIRDANKLVRLAVLGNPQITRDEVKAFEADPTIQEDVKQVIRPHLQSARPADQ